MEIVLTAFISALLTAGVALVLFSVYRARVVKQSEKMAEELASALSELNERDRTIEEQTGEFFRLNEEYKCFRNQISHELRVPVSIIQGYADIIRDGLADDRETERLYMRKIGDKASELTQMIQSVLIAARYDNDSLRLECRRCDLNGIITASVTDLSQTLAKNNIDAQLHLSEEPIFVNADSVKLKQVFYNILENSAKYMGRAGSVTVTCSYAEDRAYIIFRDDGEGMKPDDAEHIFERSFRGENAIKNAKNGTGLGMYITKAIIELHGGSVSVKSSAGEGMAVLISLPAECTVAEEKNSYLSEKI